MTVMDNLKESFLTQFEGIDSPIATQPQFSSVFSEAWTMLMTQPLPHNKLEEWRYTNFSEVWKQDFFQTASQDIEAARLALPAFSKLPNMNILVCLNGQFVQELSCLHADVRACLQIKPMREAIHTETDLFKQHKQLNTLPLAINAVYLQDGLCMRVMKTLPKGAILCFLNIIDATAQNIMVQPRHLWHFAANTQAVLLEKTITLGENHSLLNQVSEIRAEQNTFIQHAIIQDDKEKSSQITSTHIHLEKSANYHHTTLTFNGLCVRNDLYVRLSERCEAFMNGLYVTKGRTLVDNHTVADHAEPNAQSNELYKGILNGHSTGIFNGKIFVREDAQKTNAYQNNRNIMLSPTAQIYTKPQLEIWADDVKCSHGTTTGALDTEPMFYLKARGIPEDKARALLLNAFAYDVLERVPSEPLKVLLQGFLAEKLGMDLD